MVLFFSLGSADGMGRRLHSAPGLHLLKTPAAEMEHALHEPSTVPVSQVSVSSAKVLDSGGGLERKACREASGSGAGSTGQETGGCKDQGVRAEGDEVITS